MRIAKRCGDGVGDERGWTGRWALEAREVIVAKESSGGEGNPVQGEVGVMVGAANQ